ncbi:hypothetical protein B9Z55_007077 [Caenorhabditis nigoni]|uniref:BTB domain-containing protein n=1 Tax=Caenorhabditis nigoni TaxID=1611254 RepID=A0A2G5V801_9PELO|nr:hypothetical protein B9Z55_007077 [Caenorhabditis nigoni]
MANDEGSDSGIGENSQIDSLSENRKLRAQKEEILKEIKLMMDAQSEKLTEEQDKKFKELSERLQSMENLISKISKIDEDVETKENSKQDIKTPEKLPNTIDSKVSKNSVPESEKRFVLKHVFKNVENFEEGKQYNSDFENHFNVYSCIELQRLNDHLACFVQIRGPKDEWAVETKVNIKIDGRNQKSEDQNFDHCFKEIEGWGFDKFLKWDEMKNEYLVDGKLTVEAHVQVIETSGLGKEKIRNFDESQKDVSDLVVSVRNAKFYVVRMYLAAQSSFFKALLLGNFAESKKSEITLTGIDPSDFHYFLEVLYGEWAMDESTVEGVALLADMYDAPTAVRRCETFLLNESKKSLKKKLQLATRYHLENLKEKCLEEIKTVTDLRSVLPADLNDLDPKVMADLFKKSISFH